MNRHLVIIIETNNILSKTKCRTQAHNKDHLVRLTILRYKNDYGLACVVVCRASSINTFFSRTSGTLVQHVAPSSWEKKPKISNLLGT